MFIEGAAPTGKGDQGGLVAFPAKEDRRRVAPESTYISCAGSRAKPTALCYQQLEPGGQTEPVTGPQARKSEVLVLVLPPRTSADSRAVK
jgi:hypothetical protein